MAVVCGRGAVTQGGVLSTRSCCRHSQGSVSRVDIKSTAAFKPNEVVFLSPVHVVYNSFSDGWFAYDRVGVW